MNSLWQISEGFGINTNILETNVLNLAAVIGILVVLGGDVVTSVLNTRRERILQTLSSADERFQEAQARIQVAEKAASQKIAEALIVSASVSDEVRRARSLLAAKTLEEKKRLEESHATAVAIAQRKANQKIQKTLVDKALKQAENQLEGLFLRGTAGTEGTLSPGVLSIQRYQISRRYRLWQSVPVTKLPDIPVLGRAKEEGTWKTFSKKK